MIAAPSSRRLLLPVLGGVLLGLLVAAAVLLRGWQDVARQGSQQLAGLWIQGQQHALQQGLARFQRLGLQLSSALAQAQDADLQLLARQHGLTALRLLPVSGLQADAERPAPVNYAALELLRRAAAGEQPQPEAYLIDGHWLLYGAVPMPSAPLPSVLLLAGELQPLLDALPPLPADLGQLQLVQQPGAQVLLNRGSASGEHRNWPTAHPGWQLELIAGPALQLPRPASSLLLLSALALLVCSLLGTLLGLSLQGRAVAQMPEQQLQPRSPRPPPERVQPSVASEPPVPAPPASKPATPSKPAAQAGDDVFDLSDGD